MRSYHFYYLLMAEAWKLARKGISKAQTHQKKQHDKLVKNSKFSEGDVVRISV